MSGSALMLRRVCCSVNGKEAIARRVDRSGGGGVAWRTRRPGQNASMTIYLQQGVGGGGKGALKAQASHRI